MAEVAVSQDLFEVSLGRIRGLRLLERGGRRVLTW
jgi:hypothetical protein